jgi:precorrin-6B methylase 2
VDTIERFLSSIPTLHSWDGGTTWNTGGFTRRELEAIVTLLVREVGPGAMVAETGAGNSTIAMIVGGASKVISVAPDAALFERITTAVEALGLDASVLSAVQALSEDALPGIAADIERGGRLLDFALIDGGHGWPTVFVDFCYLNRVLRKDGFLMVDDFQIYAVKELVRMLEEDGNFVAHARFRKTIIYRKRSGIRYLPDFGGQPYIRRRSREDKEAGRAFAIDA